MSCCKHFSADFFHKRGRENSLFAWYFCGRYTTTGENGELRLKMSISGFIASYTTTRENGELRHSSRIARSAAQLYHYERKWGTGNYDNVSAPQYSVRISPHIISAFTVFVNPQMERNVFNKNSPWKWMLPSLEFPWQALIRLTAEMQFAF